MTETKFRQKERFFKHKVNNIDYLKQFTLNGNETSRLERLDCDKELMAIAQQLSSIFGLDFHSEKKPEVYKLDTNPGVLLYKNILDENTQAQLIAYILESCTQLPNLSNLDTHYMIPEESAKWGGLWNMYEDPELETRTIKMRKEISNKCAGETRGKENAPEPELVQVTRDFSQCVASCKCADCMKAGKEHDSRYTEPDVKFASEAYAFTYPSDGESRYSAHGPSTTTVSIDPPICSTHGMTPLCVKELVHKLRWYTLGYHYHWASKLYHASTRYPFPHQLELMSKTIADHVHTLGMGPAQYVPEAGIINFYGPRDALMAHVDQSEPAIAANAACPPILVSLSLGLSAIFLMGGLSRDIEPETLFLESGDIVVLSGEARRAFHGVPRVFNETLSPCIRDSEHLTEKMRKFISQRRINVNIRQVY